MAGKQRPSFLKRQKEQKRLARAAEKRETRRLKKRGVTADHEKSGDSDEAPDDLVSEQDAVPDDAGQVD